MRRMADREPVPVRIVDGWATDVRQALVGDRSWRGVTRRQLIDEDAARLGEQPGDDQ